MTKWLHTATRINADKFLIVALMLYPDPFFLCLLHLLILVVPMKLIWAKKQSRLQWRCISCSWLLISLVIAVYCSFMVSSVRDGYLYASFPLEYAESDSLWWGNIGWVHGLNISIVTGVLMLPLTSFSLIRAKKQST